MLLMYLVPTTHQGRAGHSPDETRNDLGAAAPDLLKLLPELALSLPRLAPAAAFKPEDEKRRFFHALAQFFTRLAGAQPLLVVFEDLHWSDDTSLEFVLFFAHRIAIHRIVLLCTYRSDETHPSLGHFLAELDRGRLATELVLPRLSGLRHKYTNV